MNNLSSQSTGRKQRPITPGRARLSAGLGKLSNRLPLALFVALLICGARSVGAQTEQDVQERIYRIQMDENYLSAEGMVETEQAAFNDALHALLEKANELRREAKLPPISPNQLRGLAQRLTVPMGGAYYVLSYVNCADVEAAKASGAGGNKPTFVVNVSSQGGANSHASAQEQPAEQPVRPTEQPAQPIEQPTEQPAAATVAPYADSHYASVAAEFLQLGDVNELAIYLKSYVKNGQLRDYGTIKALSDIPADAYVVLIRADDRTISAILSPGGTNMKTGRADNLTNYKGHQVLWYR